MPDYGAMMIDALLKAFVTLFSTWYMWAFVLLILAMKYGPGLIDGSRLRKAGMPEIDRMSGLEFEKYLEILFQRLGYQVERTSYVGDQGGDLVLSKGGERILVQAKRHSKAVGNKAVQEAAAARPHYRCQHAMVVANQDFTRAARELAQSNQVELWGRNKLAEVVLSLQAQVAPAKATPAKATPIAGSRAPSPSGPATRTAAGAEPARPTTASPAGGKPASAPTCNRCGRSMVLRDSARGKFWGCSGFPSCRNIAPVDKV